MVVETAAARHIDVMMEKPLAVSMQHARRIEQAAKRNGIHVIVNYETTWYRSHAEMRRALEGQGEIRKMVAMDGHSGPKGDWRGTGISGLAERPREERGGSVV